MLVKRYPWTCDSQKGSSMIMVLLVFFVFTLLSMALLTLALTSSTAASSETKSQQAYLTARSANNAAIAALKTDPTLQATVQAWAAAGSGTKTGTGSYGSMGQYQVTYTYVPASKKVKITATSTTKDGSKQTVISYMDVQTTTIDLYYNPFLNVRTINGLNDYNNPHVMYGATSSGSITYEGCTSIGGGATINGTLCDLYGDLYISNQVSQLTDIKATNNIYLCGKCFYNGRWISDYAASLSSCNSIQTEGSIFISTGSSVNFDVYWRRPQGSKATIKADGDIRITGGSGVYADIICGGNVYVENGSSVYGSITAAGTITGSGYTQNASASNPAAKTPYKLDFTPAKNMPTSIGYGGTDKDNTINTYEDASKNAVITPSKNNKTATLTSDGIITQRMLNNKYGYPYDALYIDTGVNQPPDRGNPLSNKAVKIVLKNDTSNPWFDLNTNIFVSGDNYLYIYLESQTQTTKRVDLYLDSAQIGMAGSGATQLGNDSVTPRILIMGNDTHTMYFEGSSMLRAFVYLPKGLWTSDSWYGGGYGYQHNGFFGSAVINNSTITISGNATIDYCAPLGSPTAPLAGTPLEDIAKGVFSTGSYKATGWSGS